MKTKKRFLVTALAFIFAFAILPTAALHASDITVTIDGQAVVFADQQPTIIDGRTLVPVRGVFEQLGFYVGWDGDNRQATLTSDDYTVVITIDSATFTTNGASHEFDVPAQIIGGSTMVPLRYVLESVGYELDWDGATQTVLISSAPIVAQVPPPDLDIPDYVTIGTRQFSTSTTMFSAFGAGLTDEDISQLRYMVNLVVLELHLNNISDLSPFANLTNLEALYLSGNQITDISPLANLTNLTVLYMAQNQITDISPLANLTNLRQLNLSDNPISDISPLSGLENLRRLSLFRLPVTDLSPIEHIQNEVAWEFEVYHLVNQVRAEYGLPPLIWDDRLAYAARLHSIDMANNNFVGHRGSDGSNHDQRIRSAIGDPVRVGVIPMTTAENVSSSQRSPEAVMAAWMNSEGHRANILSGMTHIGVGFENGRWTQKFAFIIPFDNVAGRP